MTVRCTACKLDAAKRDAIDAALSANVSLEEVSRSCGISKSSLHRHAQHLPQGVVKVLPTAEVPAMRPARSPEPLISTARALPPADATKAQLLDRIEMLWGESLEGLRAAKEPILLTKPDGSSMEIPGDLRARAAFVRGALQVLELQGTATGVLDSGPTTVNNMLYVVMGVPQPLQVEQTGVIDAEFRELGSNGDA